MAYENLKLKIAALSGEIYLARVNKNGMMSESRRIATDDCIAATTEWFIKNKKNVVVFEEQCNGLQPSLFYTDDADKSKRIEAILNED
ncbi:DUF7446 family protein [Shouchella clausii]|uniref:DUF7446 family protein n=1 Tax=Shouchella clausii TaxID=79880 RepID=UPI001C73AFB6|nr:hypothetical protein [Shouchella clausii]MBX0320118.1 hypothetical protein [Shouchella clausii]